ncbi:hypothetical protein CFP56_034804 [Quercus suber]|uniref:Uncharacterized protein n=1 Tax=Quercus suber TaxID=58331 RepID=A0AAW0LQU2_QUESU
MLVSRGCIFTSLKGYGKIPSDHVVQNGYSSLLSFTVTDINSTVTKLMTLGAELDGPIKYEIHGKAAKSFYHGILDSFDDIVKT